MLFTGWRQTWTKKLGTLALLLLAFTLPFELNAPIFTVGPLSITNVELILSLILLLASVSWLKSKTRTWPPGWWLWLAVFYLAVLFSTFLVVEHQGNTLRAALRLLSGILLALAVPLFVHSKRQLRLVSGFLLAGGFLAIVIGLIESANNFPASWLVLFRSKETVVGQFVRLSGPFDYANQAAMFIEATIFFWLAWVWWVYQHKEWGQKRTAVILFLLLATLMTLEASFRTLSRASWMTIGVVSLVLLLFVDRHNQTRRKLWFGLATAVVLLFGVNTAVSSAFRLRLQSEADQSWYQIQLNAPAQLHMAAQETQPISVEVSNQGALTWHSRSTRPINLGAHWIDKETGLEYSQPRWPFPTPIAPGDHISLTIPVQAPHIPGDYLLEWDVVQEEVVWFSEKNGVSTLSEVSVRPNTMPISDPPNFQAPVPLPEKQLPIPNRLVLWSLASQLFWQRPLTGIGLDNFRLTYGQLLGAKSWNETIHVNNWYLETLVSVGLLGAIPFFIWLAMLGLDLLRTGRQPNATIWQLALSGGLLAYLIHGFLDYFLLFNATGLLFWLLVGLWLSTKYNAHRI